MRQSLGIIVPTNQPKDFFNLMFPSIQYLTPMLKEVSVTFLFHFQPPWTPTQMREVEATCCILGFGYRSCFTAPSPPVKMASLRGDAAGLMREATWYMFADDNMIFVPQGTPLYPEGSATRYLQVLDYFNSFHNCGTIKCQGTYAGYNHKYQIKPTKNGAIATAKGLFFRNLYHGALFSPVECGIKGSLEETYPAFRMMMHGFYVAKQFNNPTRHVHRHHFKHQVADDHITNYEKVIKPNGERYVRETYDDPTWTHQSKRFPPLIWKRYAELAGGMSVFETKHYWKDYRP